MAGRDSVVRRRSEAAVETIYGSVRFHAYESTGDGLEHAAVVHGQLTGPDPILVRVHSECLTGDVFGSLRCDCGSQLQAAQGLIAAEGRGVVIYLRGHEGRGIGLAEKLLAYELQDGGLDTVEANLALGHPVDSRDYAVAAQILVDLGVRSVRLLSNNPAKSDGLAEYGLQVERIALRTPVTRHNVRYLETKRRKLGHDLLDVVPHKQTALSL